MTPQELNPLPNLTEYKIRSGIITTEVDEYGQKVGKIMVTNIVNDEHDNHKQVTAESIIEECEGGGYIKTIDAQEIYEMGFRAGEEATKQHIAKNIFGIAR